MKISFTFVILFLVIILLSLIAYAILPPSLLFWRNVIAWIPGIVFMSCVGVYEQKKMHK